MIATFETEVEIRVSCACGMTKTLWRGKVPALARVPIFAEPVEFEGPPAEHWHVLDGQAVCPTCWPWWTKLLRTGREAVAGSARFRAIEP